MADYGSPSTSSGFSTPSTTFRAKFSVRVIRRFVKTHDNLFNQICCFENIHSAYLKARKNKRYRNNILDFSGNLEKQLLQIKEELETGAYKHGEYREFIVCDSKKRQIKAPCFKDRVVHHALCNIIDPIFNPCFIFDSYACRKSKGTHRAIKRLKTFLKNKNNVYCFQCDISKYFDSISHDILILLIKKEITCLKTIALIEEIINSSFKKEPGTGIPIGNLTSQLFANIYLNKLDQFVKQKLKSVYYLCYMDDFLFFGKNKSELNELSKIIGQFLYYELKLTVNSKKIIIFPCSLGIDFLGYIVFKDYILLRKATVKKFLGKIKNKNSAERKATWFAYAKHANSYLLSKKLNLLCDN